MNIFRDICAATGLSIFRILPSNLRCFVTLRQIERQSCWFAALDGKLHHHVRIFNSLGHMMYNGLSKRDVIEEPPVPACPRFPLRLADRTDLFFRLRGRLTAGERPEESRLTHGDARTVRVRRIWNQLRSLSLKDSEKQIFVNHEC